MAMMNDMMPGGSMDPGMGGGPVEGSATGFAMAQPVQQGAQGAPQQDQQAMLQAVSELGDQLIQLVGVEGLAQVLQDALQQALSQGEGQPAEGRLPSSAPPKGGEAFGRSYE